MSSRGRSRRSAPRLTIVAVGGYGRGALAPGSDIDLLFLLPYKQTPWGESVVEAMLYVLWDLRQKVGHATRSDRGMSASGAARHDDPHRRCSKRASFSATRSCSTTCASASTAKSCAQDAREFVAAKLAERDARDRARPAHSRYLVEPNVKEGKGGLRDLNTLFWIAKYVYRVREAAELVAAGLFTRREFGLFCALRGILVARCAAICISSTGRAEERL